jgi:uncharacterized membrane protein
MPNPARITEDQRTVARDPNGHADEAVDILADSAESQEDYPHATDEASARFSFLAIALFCVLLTGFLLRLASAEHLSSHVDESASIMAAQMVADKGVPVYPSGTLYLQGATVSYLIAPLIKLGYGGLDHLFVLRILSVIAGTLAILALYVLTRWLTRSSWTALGVAALLALDPASVRWSGLIRMYALLQLVAIVVLFLFLHILRTPSSRRMLYGFVAAFWFAVFTHIAICLFLPSMIGLAAWKHRIALIGRRIDLTFALLGACAAPFTLLALNRLITPAEASAPGASSGMSFVGDYLISVDQILHPTLKSWRELFSYSGSGVIVPYVIGGITLVLLGRYFLDAALLPWKIERRNILGILIMLYWPPILLVAAFTNESNERYLLHLHPLGMMLVGFAVQELVVGEHARPVMDFAPADAREWTTAGWPAELASTRIGQRLQVLTVSRVYAAMAGLTLALGGALRLWGYDRLSLWLDEGYSLLYSKQSWASAAGFNGFYSRHPPLYFTLVKVSNLVVSDVRAGRVVSVICGILVLPIFLMLARRLLDPVAAVIATGVFALSPIHIYYSQESRMYTLVVLAVTASFLALVAFRQTRHNRWAVVYGVSLAVAVYGDYSALFVLGPQAAVLLYFLVRDRRRMLPMVIAAGIAVLAYAPWLPQILESVHSANEDERRDVYLGAGFTRIMTIILRITGISSDSRGAYFPSVEPSAWDRLHAVQPIILIAIAPVAILGIVGLWNRWSSLAIVVSIQACIVVAVIVSLLSPGFAERTILSATVGWALMLGAAFNGKWNRDRTPLAALSLLVVLGLSLTTIQNIHVSAVKQRWNVASAELAMVSPLHLPVITFSYGAVADTLVEAYEPGLLEETRLITVRDGELEKTLSNDVIPRKGITIADVDAGKFDELLPQTPENDLVWYFYYQRSGEENVHAGIVRSGYSRIMHKVFSAPRGLVFLDLFARPGANVGDVVAGIPSFENGQTWGIPSGLSPVQAENGGTSVSITNLSKLGTAAVTQVKSAGPAVYTVDVDVQTQLPGSRALVTLTCVTQTGGVLEEITAPTDASPVNGLRHHQSAIICPAETDQVRVTLRNLGIGEMHFGVPELRRIVIPAVP